MKLQYIQYSIYRKVGILRFSDRAFGNGVFSLGLFSSYVRWKPRNGQLAKMRSFHQSKRSDNKQYVVEVRWGIFFENLTNFFLFLRAVVNIPIQTLIIPPWPLLRKMIISQLKLGPPAQQYANLTKIHWRGKCIATFSILALPADWRIFFLGAATGLHDDDSTFECFTIEFFALWAEIPA